MRFIALALLLAASLAAQAQTRIAQYASLEYDVVYVRCPRGREPVNFAGKYSLLNWNGANDVWLDATNNVYQQPGCDLVLHHSDAAYKSLPPGHPGREEVLVDCNEASTAAPVCTVADPAVSLDGSRVAFVKFMDTRSFVPSKDWGFGTPGSGPNWFPTQSRMDIFPTGNAAGRHAVGNGNDSALAPYAAPALVFEYDLRTRGVRQVSPAPRFNAGRAFPDKPAEWAPNIPVMDTGPFYLPGGRIGFTSNRDSGSFRFELFTMDLDGRNLELIGHRAMNNQLHPVVLMDGRILYTSNDAMLQKVQNNRFSLFTVNPDGSFPFIFAGKLDSTKFSYHFATQLSDGDIVTGLYYNNNNSGLGALQRIPLDAPGGAHFVHLTQDYKPLSIAGWRAGNTMLPFAKPGEYRLTPLASAGDIPSLPYAAADRFLHPSGKRVITMGGRYTHPAAAPDNGLLATYSIGGNSNNAVYGTLEAAKAQLGRDGGIWHFTLTPNGKTTFGHIVDAGRIVVDQPQYHEIMARPVVSYARIYGRSEPAVVPPTANTPPGQADPRLAPGAPHGLTGAASLYDRETAPLNGMPWNAIDTGPSMSGRAYSNLGGSGAELAIHADAEVYGIRVTVPVQGLGNWTAMYKERWTGYQKHHLRILGEFPVRKPDGTPLDGQGNPDTSFIVKLPADTPFFFQTIDRRGMALDMETTSRTVTRGETQVCAGCHVHTRTGLDPLRSSAWLDKAAPYGNFAGASAPLFAGLDAAGKPTVASARQIYPALPGVAARRSFAVDWTNGIAAVIQNRCAACHAEGAAAQRQTGLRLDGTQQTYDLLMTGKYLREDGQTVAAGGARYACCTASRWISFNSARSSMLVWALYGERMDGRDPATGLPPRASGVLVDDKGLDHPETWLTVASHKSYVAAMPEAEKRLIARWIDIGAPLANVHEDLTRPVLTLTSQAGPSGIAKVLVGLWDDSPIDYARLRVLANGVDITPAMAGAPEVVAVTLPQPITAANADAWEFSFEVWDRPDRRYDLNKPALAAANRTLKRLTGRALLRLAGN